MSLSIKKKQEIYDYYSENGFQHSTEQIVKKLNICHKTFFNRYGSKSNSIEIAWNYWQDLCREKWTRILENCNHCIEELLIIIYNIYKTKEQNVHYYEFTRDSRKYRETNSYFFSIIYSILEKGKKCFHVQENLNTTAYTSFLLNNLFLIEAETDSDKRRDVFKFVLNPALTERGFELFMETPFV
ncbi:MAG: hypothetical protein K5882_12830 [Bacteroidales bacterium]|nr:hypothetical protein [Bacteroidales bacterium]